MATIDEFILEDVRCFRGKHHFTIRPLTFLIGENSTGKSTVLGCFHALMNSYHYSAYPTFQRINFNIEPFSMGSFSDIVRRGTPKIREMKMGIKLNSDNNTIIEHYVTLEERERGSEPIDSQHQLIFPDGGEITWKKEQSKGLGDDPITIKANKDNKFRISFHSESPFPSIFRLLNRLPFLRDQSQYTDKDSKN